MSRPRFSKRAFLSGLLGGMVAVPSLLVIKPAREGAKELIDHWKADKVVIQEVNVPVEVVEERLVVKEVPVEVTKEVERVREVPVEVVKEKIVYRDIEADPPAPPPPPLPLSYVPSKKVDVKDLFNKIQIRTDVAIRKGSLPSVERAR